MRTATKVNAILLAGDRRASIQLHSDNKAFFELKGVPLFIHVARALMGAELVGDVVIVGPAERIRESLNTHGI